MGKVYGNCTSGDSSQHSCFLVFSNVCPFLQLHLCALRSYRAVLGARPEADLCMLFLGNTGLIFLCSLLIGSCFLCIQNKSEFGHVLWLFVGVWERDGDEVPNEKLYHEFIWEAGLSRWCSLPT